MEETGIAPCAAVPLRAVAHARARTVVRAPRRFMRDDAMRRKMRRMQSGRAAILSGVSPSVHTASMQFTLQFECSSEFRSSSSSLNRPWLP